MATGKHPVAAPPPPPLPPISDPASKQVQVGSPTARKTFVTMALVILILAIGGGGYMFYANRTGTPAEKPKTEAKAPEPVPETNAPPPELTVDEINSKMDGVFESLSTFSADVKCVSMLDVSALNPLMPGLQTNETDISIKLGKTNLYRVDWKRIIGKTNVVGGIWNCGEGDYLLMPDRKYSKVQNRQQGTMMLSAMLMGSTVGNIIESFFVHTNSQEKLTKDKDESLEGEECYVLSYNQNGIKARVWVSKASFLIQQTQVLFGEQGGEAVPEENAAPAQSSRRNKRRGAGRQEQQVNTSDPAAVISKIKGSILETWKNIQTNQPISTASYKCELPKGAKPGPKLF